MGALFRGDGASFQIDLNFFKGGIQASQVSRLHRLSYKFLLTIDATIFN
jgi:hypothetical protein